MADDYTPTTRGVRQGYASGKLHRREMMPVAAKKAFDRWLAQYTAEKRAEWEAEQGDRVPESATISYWTELDGDYAEASTTLAQADYVRREARGHIAVSDRKIWKHVEFEVDVPVPDTTNAESEGE